MSRSRENLKLAVQHHRAGNLKQAEQLYLEVLESEPDNADAHHLLGMAVLVQGQAPRAVEHFQRAVQNNQQSVDFRHHLGVALSAAGRKPQAIEMLRQALAQAPTSATICNDLAGALCSAGQSAEAEACFRRAIELDPNMVEAHNNLGNLLRDQKRLGEAIDEFQVAARLGPDTPEVQFNLGNCYCDLERWADAAAAFRQAIVRQPNLAIAHRSLAVALYSLKDYPAAAASFQEAIRLSPNYVDALSGLGAALQAMDRVADARICYEKVLALKPSDPTALYNLGVAEIADGNFQQAERLFHLVMAEVPGYVEGYFRLGQCARHQGNFAQAVWAYQEAIRVNPNHADAHYSLGEVYLAQGELLKGWEEYAWRLQAPHVTRPAPQPLLPGTNLAGAKVLVAAEGGLGDTLHFIRYVPLLIERGAKVAIEAQRILVPFLEQSGYEQISAVGDPRPFEPDWEVPMLSLPRALATSLDTIPANVPYLSASGKAIDKWRKRLSTYDGFKIGVHWHGSRSWKADPRSIPLAALEPLAKIEGVRLFSLQKNDDDAELSTIGRRLNVVDFGAELDASGAFVDTAALMTLMDLVITCDTAAAHLAGGLGVRTWLVLARFPDWRWLLDRSDSPWYPSMRLFRQRQSSDWIEVFQRIADEVNSIV